ncbi:MAG: hypothetical protein KC486_26885 [Myxococcales bacterium]|nr:hypothetical protein [Myxococcales bacterium]
MTHTTTTILSAAAAATLLCLGGCDSADLTGVEGDVSFREDPWGTGRLNTLFLGQDETWPIDALPLIDDPEAAVRLHAVWTNHCVNEMSGQVFHNELFYTSDLDGDLGITVTEGKLGPATFRKYGDPATTCTVKDADWVGTVWGVITTKDDVTKNHYMMLRDRTSDENGNPVHEWGVYSGEGDMFASKTYLPTCVEDVDPNATFNLRYHAYLVDGLDVDTATGDFTASPDQFTIACRSGAIGKAMFWGYIPWDYGMDVHELGARMVRADYCGTGQPNTEVGTLVQISDVYGVNGFGELLTTDEAAWDLETGAATCVTMPRKESLQLDFDGFSCGDTVLPVCDENHFAAAEMRSRLGGA